MRKLYLLLAIVGLVLPYYFFMSFLITNGLDLQLFFSQLFANNISTFFVVDLVITAIVFWVFLYQEAQRWQMGNWWIYIVATLAIGPSFSLPLFLYFREKRVEALASEKKG
jgi:Ca2+/H+ antiporter